MKEILLLILGGVLANNYAFEKFLGVTPLLGYSRKEKKLVALGLSVTVVMLLVAAIAYPVQAALANSGFGYLRLLVFVVLVLLINICAKIANDFQFNHALNNLIVQQFYDMFQPLRCLEFC